VADLTSFGDLNSIISYMGIPYSYFLWPDFLTMLLIPGVLMGYTFYSFLNNKGPLQGNAAINIFLAILITIMSIRFSYIMLWISVGYIFVFRIHSMRWRLTFVLIVASIYFSLSLLIIAVWSFVVSIVYSAAEGRFRSPVAGIIAAIIITAVFFYLYANFSQFIPSTLDLLSGKFLPGG